MFQSCGKLIYSSNPYKLIVDCDNEISFYYRSLIPKYLKVQKTRYSAHISLVRKEIPINLEYWRKYHNQNIVFQYESYIYNDELYYWLNAYSPRLEKIRHELGLTKTSAITKSPDGRHKFHITIGNLK